MTTVVLDSVIITTGLVWSDKQTYSPVAQNFRRTLAGSPVIDYGSLSNGRPVTLISLRDQGWLTKTQVDALQVLADAPGAVYSLTVGSESFSAMFRHHDAPAFEATPLIPRTESVTGDWFSGTIRLMTV